MLYNPIDKNSDNEEDQILMKHFTHQERPEYGLFGKTRICLPVNFKRIFQRIKEFEVRDDDVFVVSFAKAGTTWTQEMVWLIANNLNYESAKCNLSIRFPFMEIEGMGLQTLNKKEIPPNIDFTNHPINIPPLQIITNSLDYINTLPSPRFIKSHLAWELLPEQIINGTKKAKIIYPSRGIKDCIVSFYYHNVMFDGYEGSFDDFLKIFVAGKIHYAPYWPHVLEFWKRRHQENILFIRYEDMKLNLVSVIKEVCSFLNKSYSEDQIKGLADHLCFKNMKKNPAVNYESLVNIKRQEFQFDKDISFLRSGKVGDFKSHMKSEQISLINELSKNSIKGSDYPIDYI